MKTMVAAKAAALVFVLWLIFELIRGGVPWTPAFFMALAFLWVTWKRCNGRLWDEYPATAVFLISLTAYLSTFRWHGGDDIPNSLIPFAILRYGTLRLDPVLNPWLTGKTHDFTVPWDGHILSFYPVAPGVMALPVYLIPALARTPINETFLHNLSKISASLITAGSAAALYAAAAKRCSRKWALNLAFLYAMGSWAFSVSSQALYQHGPAQLGIALGLLGLETEGRKGDLLAGFGMALAVAARPDSVFIFIALAGFFLFRNSRRLPGFALGTVPPLGLLAAYWLYYTGRLKPPEYAIQQTMFTHFQPEALIGLLASPTRGLLLFFPAAIFSVWASIRRNRNPSAPWLLAGCAATWIFFSFYAPWMGGSSYGPRYLAGIAVVLTYLCCGIEQDIRRSPSLLWAWCIMVSGSILIHSLGGYMTWPGSVQEELAMLWNWGLHPIPHLFSSSGNLRALPAFIRIEIGVAALASCAWLAIRLHRVLDDRDAEPGLSDFN